MVNSIDFDNKIFKSSSAGLRLLGEIEIGEHVQT